MKTKIFVNLPVRDLNKSVVFFTQLGFTVNPAFTNESATCLVISSEINAMLLTHETFEQFTERKVADASTTSESFNCLSLDRREAVNSIAEKAVAFGAKEVRDPKDFGFMYTRSFRDLDGHIWDVIWVDQAMATSQQEKAAEIIL